MSDGEARLYRLTALANPSLAPFTRAPVRIDRKKMRGEGSMANYYL